MAEPKDTKVKVSLDANARQGVRVIERDLRTGNDREEPAFLKAGKHDSYDLGENDILVIDLIDAEPTPKKNGNVAVTVEIDGDEPEYGAVVKRQSDAGTIKQDDLKRDTKRYILGDDRQRLHITRGDVR